MLIDNSIINTRIYSGALPALPKYSQSNWARLTVPNLSLESEKFFLGVLCKRQHDWLESGKSLRRKINNSCVECEKYREVQHRLTDPDWGKKRYARIRETSRRCNRRFHETHPDYKKQYNEEYRRKNYERIIQQGKKHYQENRERILAANRPRLRKFYSANKFRIRLKCRAKYYQNLESSRQISQIHRQKRRARKQANHHVGYTLSQVKCLQQQFDNRCAYCGVTEKLTLDHFIPVSKGGPDCIGNLLPVCGQCNSSKHDSDPVKWYKSQRFYSLKRWRHILKALGKTEATCAQLPLL